MRLDFLTLIAALSFLAPAPGWAAASDACRTPTMAGQGVDCAAQSDCVEEQFSDVLSKKPEVECRDNIEAGWDHNVAAEFQRADKSEGTPDGTVCRASYLRLQKAVSEYKTTLREACTKANDTQLCRSSADQKQSHVCSARQNRDAAASSARARQAMERAVAEANQYRELTQKVKGKYQADLNKIRATESELLRTGRDPDEIRQEKARTQLLTGREFSVNGTGLLGSLRADVDAKNGGASTISGYESRQARLTSEQDAAAANIDAFNRIARGEIQNRANAERALLAAAAENDRLAGNGGPPSSPSPRTKEPPSTITPPAKKEEGLLAGLNPNTLTALGAAATGLAGAVNRANAGNGTAASQPYVPGLNQGTSPTPGSAGNQGPDTSRFGGNSDPGHTVNTSPDPAAPKGDFSRPGQISSGPGGSPRFGGAIAGSPSGDLSGRTPSSSSSPSSATGGGGGDVGIKDSGRKLGGAPEEKSPCAAGDCNAMEDLKTAQFNAGGALGVPKIGAPDPALATKGALDNLFGPLPGLEPFGKPADPSAIPGGVPGFSAQLADLDGNAPEAGPGEAHAAALEVPGVNSRSLFLRVHGAHENALKKGVVSLFHKRL